MKHVLKAAVVVVIVTGMSVAVLASPVSIAPVPEDFNNLLGGSASAIGLPTTTDMSISNLQAEVVSQAFTDGADNYMYLYQIRNTGTTGNSVVEVFTCNPFFDASASTTLGYLTDNAPSGFSLGTQSPAGASADTAAGPTVSFGFPAWTIPSYAIDPPEDSVTLYILSDGVPGTITGNVINGVISSGDVVGPVPEPATMGLLALGGLALLRRRHKRM